MPLGPFWKNNVQSQYDSLASSFDYVIQSAIRLETNRKPIEGLGHYYEILVNGTATENDKVNLTHAYTAAGWNSVCVVNSGDIGLPAGKCRLSLYHEHRIAFIHDLNRLGEQIQL